MSGAGNKSGMRISVRVKAGARSARAEKIGDKNFLVSVKEKAVENRANLAVVKVLADYFGVPKSGIKIISGLKSKTKIAEVLLSRI